MNSIIQHKQIKIHHLTSYSNEKFRSTFPETRVNKISLLTLENITKLLSNKEVIRKYEAEIWRTHIIEQSGSQ